jgi:predicted RecA/RadA family phage recombinase
MNPIVNGKQTYKKAIEECKHPFKYVETTKIEHGKEVVVGRHIAVFEKESCSSINL